MSGEDEYESLPEGSSVYAILGAGAAAGVMEHCCMFPVDCVKTRMQALACNTPKFQSNSIVRNILQMIREEGIFRPMQGVQAMGMGAGPAHAIYFLSYETVKERLNPKFRQVGLPDFTLHLFAGCVATFFHDSVMTPAEVVKQRMQMCCSPYKSCTDCAVSVLRTEGARAFYRSFGTTLIHNVPFQAMHFAMYEGLMGILNPNRQYIPWTHLVAGGLAGGGAAAVCIPLDACKTLLNTQEANVLKQLNMNKVVGLTGAFNTIRRVTGFRGFFQGLWPRVLYQMPSTAISWSVYEFLKNYLNFGSPSPSPSPASEETLTDLQRRGKSESLVHHRGRDRDGDRGTDTERFSWDSIVTDLPVSAPGLPLLQAESELVVRKTDRIFSGLSPPYRDQ